MKPEDHLRLAEPDPEFLTLVQQQPPRLPPPADIIFVRQMGEQRLAATIAQLERSVPGVSELEVQIPTRDGSTIKAWVVAPNPPAADGSPVIVYFHGGGFCIGDGREEFADARRFALEAGAITLCVNYRLAPEHRFPTAVYDGQDAVNWVVKNEASIKARLSLGFIVGGVSAGANIAAVLAHTARDDKLSPPLTGQILSVPPLLPQTEVEEKYKSRYLSHEQNNKDSFLTKEMQQMFTDSYAADNKSPLWTAFKHPAGHANLPPAYIQACGLDPLRDEVLLYEEILRDDYGVKTRIDVYKGLPHHFWGFFPSLSASKRRDDDTVAGVKWLLQQV